MKALKNILIFLFFTSCFLEAKSSQILIGLDTDKILVWKFLEREGDTFKAKLLIFNNHSKIHKVSINNVFYKDLTFRFEKDTNKTEAVLKNRSIKSNKFLILDLAKGGVNNYLEFWIDSVNIGILDYNFLYPPKELPINKYYSTEGLNGTNPLFWMGKNKLFIKAGEVDSLNIYLFCENEPRGITDGVCFLKFSINDSLSKFSLLANYNKVGYFHHWLEYRYEFPVFEDFDRKTKTFLDSNAKKELLIEYKTESKKRVLGLETCFGFKQLSNDKMEYLPSASSCFLLPILILGKN